MCMEERKKDRKKEERKNNAKFSGHYVRQCMHNVRPHALQSDQNDFQLH